MRRLAVVPLLVLFTSCPEPLNYPGEELMGKFTFEAHLDQLADGGFAPPTSYDCPFEPVLAFEFDGVLSRDKDDAGLTSRAWLTFGNVSRDAGFDGQVVRSTAAAARHFEDCPETCTTIMEETLTVTLLSKDQNAALGGRCPSNPLDGGVPVGDVIIPPGSTPTGFNAIRACGEMREVVVATTDGGSGCQCKYLADGGTFTLNTCTMNFVVTGVRR